ARPARPPFPTRRSSDLRGVRRRVRALVAAGEAALRRAALLCARAARAALRRGPGARRQADPGAAPRQHVGAAVEQDLPRYPQARSEEHTSELQSLAYLV